MMLHTKYQSLGLVVLKEYCPVYLVFFNKLTQSTSLHSKVVLMKDVVRPWVDECTFNLQFSDCAHSQ